MLSRHQLERADLDIMIEQGRRVELAQFEESHRNIQTMGELLKARVFSSTDYALSMRKRMTNYVQGGASSLAPFAERGTPGHRPPELDPHPEHGVLCDCHDCDEAVKRLLRDCGILPKGKLDYGEFHVESITGRIKLPARYRRDESDR